MSGLLLKDFYLSWRYCRAFIVIVAVFLAVSFTGDDNIFFLIGHSFTPDSRIRVVFNGWLRFFVLCKPSLGQPVEDDRQHDDASACEGVL